MTTKFSSLERIIGVEFKDQAFLETALTHRSYLNEDPQSDRESNERFEFLGDAILELVASQHLFQTFPNLPEGQLTIYRSALVSTKNLARVAKKLDLGKFLLMAKGEEAGGGRKNPSLLANVVEALIGAIFLDQGLRPTQAFIEKQILVLLPKIIKSGTYKDPKSELQELVQEKLKMPPVYKVVEEEGPDHAKTFTVAVSAAGETIGQAKGPSKQQAEEKAAEKALEKLT